MKRFICIVVDMKTKADLKEYELSARDKWEAEAEARAYYKIAAHYTPRLPPIDDVFFDLVAL